MSKPGSGSFLAGNSENLREKRLKNLRPFPKGKGGNPSGRPKKAYLTKIYERILRKACTRKEIEEAFTKVLTSGRMASVLMAREMAERTEGKVSQAPIH